MSEKLRSQSSLQKLKSMKGMSINKYIFLLWEPCMLFLSRTALLIIVSLIRRSQKGIFFELKPRVVGNEFKHELVLINLFKASPELNRTISTMKVYYVCYLR